MRYENIMAIYFDMIGALGSPQTYERASYKGGLPVVPEEAGPSPVSLARRSLDLGSCVVRSLHLINELDSKDGSRVRRRICFDVAWSGV